MTPGMAESTEVGRDRVARLLVPVVDQLYEEGTATLDLYIVLQAMVYEVRDIADLLGYTDQVREADQIAAREVADRRAGVSGV